MKERARIRFHVLNDGTRPFSEILKRIKGRWPVSAAGDDFAAELRQLFAVEQRERVEYLTGLARRYFADRPDCRWDFERLVKHIGRRWRRLAKDEIFLAELRRLFAAHAGEPLQALQASGAGPRMNARQAG